MKRRRGVTIEGLLRVIGWLSGRDHITDQEAEEILDIAATQPMSEEDRAATS